MNGRLMFKRELNVLFKFYDQITKMLTVHDVYGGGLRPGRDGGLGGVEVAQKALGAKVDVELAADTKIY